MAGQKSCFQKRSDDQRLSFALHIDKAKSSLLPGPCQDVLFWLFQLVCKETAFNAGGDLLEVTNSEVYGRSFEPNLGETECV